MLYCNVLFLLQHALVGMAASERNALQMSPDDFLISLDLPQAKGAEVATALASEELPSLLSDNGNVRDGAKLVDAACKVAEIVLGPSTLIQKEDIQPIAEESWSVPHSGCFHYHLPCFLTHPGPKLAGKRQLA